MDEVNRRSALKLATLSGLTGGVASLLLAAQDPADDPASVTAGAADGGRDRQFVLAAGMTEAEADCWALAAKLAGDMFALPELHPMDNHEIAHAVHVVQNKLLARVTYRRYLEAAGKR